MVKILKLFLIVFILAAALFLIAQQNYSDEDSVLAGEEILFIGHRGASSYAPEHTILSYDLAAEKDADYIEIDIQMTKDGKLVAIHDHNVERTTNGKGYVIDYTWAQLKELDAGSWFYQAHQNLVRPEGETLAVPSLKEILERYDGEDINYYIEVKYPEKFPQIETELLNLLNSYGLLNKDQPLGRVVIQSYSIESLKLIHNRNNEIPLILLKKFEDKAVLSQKEIDEIKLYARGIGVNYKSLNQDFVDIIKDNELLLHVYTVNSPEELARMREWGVDGVFTDDLNIRNQDQH